MYAAVLRRGTPATGEGREVALKVPRPERLLEPGDAQRFVDEARMMSKVAHAGVVAVVDAGVLEDGQPYVAMERLAGETLAARISRDGALVLSEALVLFEQITDATAMLHDAGLVHRDLKAENVFLVPTVGGLRGQGALRAKLLDFGIAKDRTLPRSCSTTTGVVRGTPATMAPERFFGAPASEASDVYELAVILYVMLAGRLPWAGDETDPNARLYPLTLRQAGVAVSEALSIEVMRALSTRPEDRPGSARALSERVRKAATFGGAGLSGPTVTSEDLRSLVHSKTPMGTAVTSSPGPRAAVSQRPSRGLMAVAALAVAVATALVVGASTARGERVLATIGIAPVVVDIVVAARAAETPTTMHEVPTPPSDAKATEAPSAVAPKDQTKPSARRGGQTKRALAAPPAEPAATAAPAIPGGVYERPPY